MAALAALCGVFIVVFGLVATGRAPSEAQLGLEVTSFVGGLVLCFIAVVLARLKALERKMGAYPPPGAEPGRFIEAEDKMRNRPEIGGSPLHVELEGSLIVRMPARQGRAVLDDIADRP